MLSPFLLLDAWGAGFWIWDLGTWGIDSTAHCIESAWHRNARRRRSESRTLLRSFRSGDGTSCRSLEAARARLRQHHGTAMPAFAPDTGRNSPDAWLCHGCSVELGREVWVRPGKTECFKCHKAKPRKAKKFGKRQESADADGNWRKQRRGRRSQAEETTAASAADEAKKAYEDCKKLFQSEDHFAVKRLHARWLELQSSNAAAAEKTKEVRELEAQLNFLKGMGIEDEEVAKERKLPEAKLETAKEKAKSVPPRSPSAELRAAADRRSQAAKKKKQADVEAEATAKAKVELELREARATAALAQAQADLDAADAELEKCKRARAISAVGPCVMLSEVEAKAIATQVGMAHTIVNDARAASTKPGFAALPPAEKAIFESLINSLVGLGTALPQNCKDLAATSTTHEEPLAEDEEWGVVGADGKRIKVKKQRTL